jgi:hypothetical protein
MRSSVDSRKQTKANLKGNFMQMISIEEQLGTNGGSATTCGIGVGVVVGIGTLIPGGILFLAANAETVAMGLIAACA